MKIVYFLSIFQFLRIINSDEMNVWSSLSHSDLFFKEKYSIKQLLYSRVTTFNYVLKTKT